MKKTPPLEFEFLDAVCVCVRERERERERETDRQTDSQTVIVLIHRIPESSFL